MGIGTTLGVIGGTLGGSLGGAALESHAAGKAASTQANAANYAAELQAEEAQQGLNLQAGEYNNAQNLAAPFIQGGESAYANLESLLGVAPSTFANTPLYQPNPVNPGTINFPGTNTPLTSLSGSGVTPGYGSNIAGVNPALQVHPGPGTTASTAAGQSANPTLASTINPSLGATGSLAQGYGKTFQTPTLDEARQDPGYQFQLQQGEQALQSSAAARGGLLSGNT